jgi:hypothetical protein
MEVIQSGKKQIEQTERVGGGEICQEQMQLIQSYSVSGACKTRQNVLEVERYVRNRCNSSRATLSLVHVRPSGDRLRGQTVIKHYSVSN